ncbi:galactose oxidase-like domain-containing protein [Archangium lipolyticum]|uniref:galactose oxidase-like domain-containing protein n=1 Tax=Archangium lipolyticum TaxID=2970465 RepID=UPI00214A388D|nr:galactose oxidase-like domain-containing protein [Archangium lipolyticum]
MMVRSCFESWRRCLLFAGLLLSLVPLAVEAADPKVAGEWSPLTTFPVSMTHAHLLPTGQVMFFGEFDEGLLPPQLWDPATGALSALPRADYNIFCAGHSFLPDGRLLVTGGHEESHVGYPYVSIFNPFTLTWSRGPDMNDNRWYPTNTTLPNGDVVVLSGETHASGTCNELPQVWQSSTGTFRDLTTAVRDVPYYPRVFLAPNGKIFYSGPQRTSRWLDTEGTGTWFEGPRSAYNGRAYGSAVMIDSKVLLIGGGSPPTATVEEIDLAAPAPVWRARAPMAWPRRQLNATLLPDGKVLVSGGSSGSDFDDETLPVKVPELYDPDTNTWTKLAPAADYRGYHSAALLLPDGRVLTGGGRNLRTVEIFSPPYLEQDGTRPAIQEAPAVITPGTSFLVQTLDASRVAKVTLLALGSVTHAFDQNQRFLKLAFSQTNGGLSVTAPASNLTAPPGYYMLFIVDGQGVPSVARMVRVAQVTPTARKKIVLGDTWKYDDRGIDQGTAWLDRDFDDSAWKTGSGQLGYGDEDEGTVISSGIPTVYFRKKITLENIVTAAHLEVLYDDAIAVWINGVPVFSRNMGNGTGFAVWASGSTTNAYERVPLPLEANPFRVGENVVTAIVKQVSANSDDLTFALSLEVEQLSGPVPDTLVLTAPNAGEIFLPGASTSITWSSTGTMASVDLALSTDNGVSWTPIASGVPNTGVHAWMVPQVSTSQALVRVSRAGEPALSDVSNAPFTISQQTVSTPISFRSVWKYEDSGVDPGMHWNMPDFDDSAWKSGAGQLGYGDGDEATVLTRGAVSQPSVYFRKKILVNGAVTEASLRVLFDDGVAVFVNGTQVFTRNVGKGLAHDRYASAGTENELVADSIPAGVFVQGENTLAVVVKQTGATSPDLSFDLELRLGIVTGQ